ncbi:MAG: antibiotic biosynthesis monooxygenase [Desulfobacula sp.]|nr:antibiotic biosynthesis monooxygenase [Desulfobacula sp.]
MSVTVLIKRKVPPGKEGELVALYREMRVAALGKKGYIGGETLKRVDVDGQVLVISKWREVDDWTKWLVSKERRVFQERIDTLTSAEAKFEIYMH